MIYFIKCNEFVKIGRGAMPQERLNTLQTGNPYKIELLGAYDGSDAEERRIHDAFVQFRHHGEWYYLSETIKHFVARHCANAPRKTTQSRHPIKKKKGRQVAKPRKGTLAVYGGSAGDVKEWCETNVQASPGKEIQARPLWQAYCRWCETRGLGVLSERKFGETMPNLAQSKVRQKTRFYQNIALVAPRDTKAA